MTSKPWRRPTAFFLILSACVIFSSCKSTDNTLDVAKEIPIQNKGRIKSLDVFARETVHFLTGKETWQKKSALSFILDLLDNPEEILDIPCVRIDFIELKTALGLSADEKFFSYRQIKESFPAITALSRSAAEKRDNDQHPSKLEQKAETLYSRLTTVDQIAGGEMIKVIPLSEGDNWESPYVTNSIPAKGFRKMMTHYANGEFDEFSEMAHNWVKEADSFAKEDYQQQLRLENFYYTIKPFFYSWVLYLFAFVFLTFFQKNALTRLLGYTTVVAGLLLHTAGLILRGAILARPPVSNMYESMIFMDWILIACALGYFIAKRKTFFLSCGALISALMMIYANQLPISKSLEVLAPVLRSNYWLTVHVMTIVSSYGIFGFAMGLGHRHLIFDVLRKFDKQAEISSAATIYRLLQAGLIALFIGTVLGGVWANESWGRFWGWDPKETWALITFLGYLAVIHLRHYGKLSHFGLAMCAVFGFVLVLMTWYGVNFILGRGLHSYGTGSGGIEWFIGYLAIELCFMAFVLIKRRPQ